MFQSNRPLTPFLQEETLKIKGKLHVPIKSTSHSISTRRNFKNKRQITRTAPLYTLKTWNYLVIYFVTLTLWFANEDFSVTVTKFDDVSVSTSTYKERNEEKRSVQPSHL